MTTMTCAYMSTETVLELKMKAIQKVLMYFLRMMHLYLSHHIDNMCDCHFLKFYMPLTIYIYVCVMREHFQTLNPTFGEVFWLVLFSWLPPFRSSQDLRQPIRTFRTMFGHPRLESCCPVRKEKRAQRASPTTPTETAPSSVTLSQTSRNSSPFNRWVCGCAEHWPTLANCLYWLVDWSLYLFPTRVL